MSAKENVTIARRNARDNALQALRGERARGARSVEALRAAAQVMARFTAVHLADSRGDDLALMWAREHAKVFRWLRDSEGRALARRRAAARAAL
jgi:hypothetical protein